MSNIISSEQNSLLSQSLYKELEGLKVRIAFAKIEEDEEALLIHSSEEEHEYDEIAQYRTIRKIHQEIDKKSRQSFVRKTLPLALQVFSGIVLLFFLSLTTAMATSHTVRVKVLTFIINMEDEYTELSLENVSGEYFDVPIEWNGDYYPSLIPPEFMLNEIVHFGNIAYYNSPDDRFLEFREYKEEGYSNIDSETGTVNSISIHGEEGIVVQKEDTVYISWAQDNHFFVIRFDGTIEETRDIAESVRMIR